MAALTAVMDSSHVAGWFEGGRIIGLIAPEIAGPIESLTDSLESGGSARSWRTGSGQPRPKAWPSRFTRIRVRNSAPRRLPGRRSAPDRRAAGHDGDRVKRLLDVSAQPCVAVWFLTTAAGDRRAGEAEVPGPVLFKQVRVGRGMQPFKMLKFRTMHVHNDLPCITSS